MTGSRPAVSAERMVPVSLGLQSKQRVEATAAVAARRLTPKPTRIGNTVTISSMARPEAELMHRPMHRPSTQERDNTR